MIESSITFIQTYLLPLGALGVFAAAVLEEFIPPIPSPIIILSAGFLMVSGPVNFDSLIALTMMVVVPAAAGITIGSLLVYSVAYFAGKPVLVRWGRWLGFSWDDVEKLQNKFPGHTFDEWSLVIVRSIPLIPSVAISALCGVIRFPLRAYLVYSFLGSLVRAAILGFIGWQVVELYLYYAEIIATFEKFILGAIVIAVLLLILWRMRRSKTKFQ